MLRGKKYDFQFTSLFCVFFKYILTYIWVWYILIYLRVKITYFRLRTFTFILTFKVIAKNLYHYYSQRTYELVFFIIMYPYHHTESKSIKNVNILSWQDHRNPRWETWAMWRQNLAILHGEGRVRFQERREREIEREWDRGALW